jgi:Zn-finger nucleic acid-binding protein
MGEEGRDALTLHCSSCGAPFAADATRCAHCGAEITLEEKSLDALCGLCGARMSSCAKYCMRCGRPAPLQPVAPLEGDAACPRCRSPLRTRELPGDGRIGHVVECGRCGGLWLSPAVVDALCADAQLREDATRELLVRPLPTQRVDTGKVVYLFCPKCRDMMVRRNFGGGSNVIVDVCGRHGIWFDHAELEKVLEWVRAGGLVRAREREVRRLEEEAREAKERASSVVSAPLVESFPTMRSNYGLFELYDDLRALFGR